MTTTTLFRPVGVQELRLVLDADAWAFPSRLPEQPIFYPVLLERYAEQIARDWNTRDVRSGHAGFVTAFEVDASYLTGFEVRTVGAREHQELWVPAEDLSEFNTRLCSRIRVLSAFYGPRYESGGSDILRTLVELADDPDRLREAVERGWRTIVLEHGYWSAAPEARLVGAAGRRRALAALVDVWPFADLPLPSGALAS
jgi:hypothetical protein